VTFPFRGSGPGVQAPDGCSVELYRKFPYLGELEDYRALFPGGCSTLELGCGTGRLTRRLLEWDARVTAVDNSPQMLAAVPERASRVLGDIESLHLQRGFDVVLLASCLVNHPVPGVRSAFVECARRHLRPGGHLLLERHDPLWLRNVRAGPLNPVGPVEMSVETVRRVDDVVEMTLRYDLDGQSWRHAFSTASMEATDIEALLGRCAFGSFAWSARPARWLTAIAL
jgi:SAM-dependent methyltransferase